MKINIVIVFVLSSVHNLMSKNVIYLFTDNNLIASISTGFIRRFILFFLIFLKNRLINIYGIYLTVQRRAYVKKFTHFMI
jgi:hypothetical protein